MSEARGDVKPGDRVRTPEGTTGTVVDGPRYYDRLIGDPFTGWAVKIVPYADPQVELTRIQRDRKPSVVLVHLDRLTIISD